MPSPLARKSWKQLEDFVTFCAWTGRLRWKEQRVSVEVFLRERYHVNVSHGISGEAIARIKASLDGSNPPYRPNWQEAQSSRDR